MRATGDTGRVGGGEEAEVDYVGRRGRDMGHYFRECPTPKNKGKSIHEIIVKHEHQETPSSMSTTKSFPESVGSSSLQSNEIRMINDRIEVINDLLKTFVPEDPEFSEFTKQKRALLLRKLKVLPSLDNKELFFSPNK